MKDEGADFENNDGIYLWRSTDLDTWTPLGKVWDIERDGGAWQKEYRIPGNNLLRTDFCRGVTAPEIHFLDGAYYLAYSMNGRGTGLLKSKTGKAEGPYEDLGRLSAMGESPSIFADVADGKRYWLWGRGLQIAPLAAAGNALEGPARDLMTDFIPHRPHGWDYVNRVSWWDVTAPFLFTAIDPRTKKPVYALTFSAVTQVSHRANRDTLIAIADGLLGPYDAAKRMIPHGGQTSVFAGPKGELFATFWGADPTGIWRDRAGIVPLEWFIHMERPWPRMVQGDYHTRRGWGSIQPIEGIPAARDPHLFAAPDGHFYYSMSDHRHPAFPKSEGAPNSGAPRTSAARGSISACSTPWKRCATIPTGRPSWTRRRIRCLTPPSSRGRPKCVTARERIGSPSGSADMPGARMSSGKSSWPRCLRARAASPKALTYCTAAHNRAATSPACSSMRMARFTACQAHVGCGA
jgi:hypothetical protein